MKQAELQAKAREELRALNIIGISRNMLKEAKAQIDTAPDTQPESILELLNVKIVGNFCKVDMDIYDKAAPRMDPYEQAVYQQLYRLSYGNGQNWCMIGYGTLAKRANVTRACAVNVLKRLEAGGWVKTVNTTGQGKIYRVFLPGENGINSQTVIESIPLNGIPPNSIPPNGILLNSTPSIPPNGIPPNGTPAPKPAPDKGADPSIPLNGIPPGRPIIDLDHIDLSLDPVTVFYTNIGQTRISKTKRERGNKVVQELVDDGFTVEDIVYAARWTSRNTTEKVYDMEILKHTIGQALSARVVADKEQKAKAEADAGREAGEARRAKYEEVKKSMSEKERLKLRARAEADIRNSGKYKEEFITEMLIETRENELLQELSK